jgi:hypothetical protein
VKNLLDVHDVPPEATSLLSIRSPLLLRFVPRRASTQAFEEYRGPTVNHIDSFAAFCRRARRRRERIKNEFSGRSAKGAIPSRPMCNLYSLTKGQAAIRDWFRAQHDRTGNLPLFPAIFRDQMAPIIRLGADGERELVMARWGMPAPPQFGGPITNIRNVNSPHWRGWLGKIRRCIVPATSFCEYEDTKPRKTPMWFALDEERPLFAFAGLRTAWRGTRGPKERPGRRTA